MKLHLGCGQKYLKGYVNIDFPISNHTVQKKSVADQHADIKKLKYNKQSITEIRLHHVFEHFSRVEVCALLTSWNSWLEKNGTLYIEVPDFGTSVLDLINPFISSKRKSVVRRHIFGSQEAEWAIHCDGYSKKSLSDIMKVFGFSPKKVRLSSWKDTRNITIISTKIKPLSVSECRIATKKYLSSFLVDNSQSEREMLNTWMNEWEKLIKWSYADH